MAMEVAVIGAGSIGVAVADALAEVGLGAGTVLLDPAAPLSLTSSKSGENYRNWWPNPVMKAFIDASISRMEAVSLASGDQIGLTRRGYLLATRAEDIGPVMAELQETFPQQTPDGIRVHESASAYTPPTSPDWRGAPDGVDILSGTDLCAKTFPGLDPSIRHLVHIRRGGHVSGHQMGQVMLSRFRAAVGKVLQADVVGITPLGSGFTVDIQHPDGRRETLSARHIVNAAGPFLNQIAAMLGDTLPIKNVLQQKLAFEDREGAISRTLPFTIDIDPIELDWSEDEQAALAEDPDLAFLAETMPGMIHRRPEGGDGGRWVKLGWAFNEETEETVSRTPDLMESYPEIVLRGAARLNPSLKQYYGHLPRSASLYGGYYTMTEENWPLIGPTSVDGVFVAGALSGFGTMAACGTGRLIASWVAGEELPDYAWAMSPKRYEDAGFMDQLRADNRRGIL